MTCDNFSSWYPSFSGASAITHSVAVIRLDMLHFRYIASHYILSSLPCMPLGPGEGGM